LFITFEGIEGCGKTTQLGLLQERLEAEGYAVEVTREPGGTPIAEAIRAILLDPANTAMFPRTELLLYEAARAQHVEERIRPALEAGRVVLCDRFFDSTTAYQGAGRCLPPEKVAWLHQFAIRGIMPDITLLLNLPVDMGMRRIAGRGLCDRLEAEDTVFHERVRRAFLALAEESPERIVRLDATAPAEAVGEAVWQAVAPRLPEKKEG
jgi:dTMP kinase